MTKTEMTEQTIADMGVHIISCPFLHRKAIASSDGFIGMGTMQDSRETRTVLEHEKQHFRLCAFYTADDAAARRRCEAQVHRALIFELCPKEKLSSLLQRGFTVLEIAEELEITEELVCEAYAFYEGRDPDFCKESC